MQAYTDHMELIQEAGLGNKASLNELAEIAAQRIKAFVFRLTLQEDLAHDISQETVTEMLEIFKKLRHRERFWYWLHGIAYNKIRRHYSLTGRRKMQPLSSMPEEPATGDQEETVAQAVTRELRQIVMMCMQKLDPRHRAILTMRCYDRLSYAQIAEHLSCTEFGARALFYRAKKSLAKQLCAHGLGKGACAMALTLFGKMTAPTKAAAASVQVTEATLGVGGAAALAGALTGKAALVSLSAGLLTAGAVMTPRLLPASGLSDVVSSSSERSVMNQPGTIWYFLPEGKDGPVMLRKLDASGQCRVLQNAEGNFVRRADRVYIRNPRDRFVDLQAASGPVQMSTDLQNRGVLIVRSEGQTGNALSEPHGDVHVTRHRNVLHEDYFQADWPAHVTLIDQRDAMHRRGWTYFTVTGRLGPHRISGEGRLPFVYGTMERHAPWMTLQLGQRWMLTDTQHRSVWQDRRTQMSSRYQPGGFFVGLSRPWMGYHTLDLIQQDAHRAGLVMEPNTGKDKDIMEVTLSSDRDRLVYTVDMERDLVTRIDFYRETQSFGFMAFDYTQSLSEASIHKSMPDVNRSVQTTYELHNGLWLLDLLDAVAME